MKNNIKKLSIGILLIMVVILGSCSNKDDNADNKSDKLEANYSFEKGYDLSQIEEDGYVQAIEKNVFNEEKIDAFYTKASEGENGRLTLFTATTEGDAIIYEIYYIDGTYTMFTDSTRDKMATEDKKIIEKSVSENPLYPLGAKDLSALNEIVNKMNI